MIVAERKGLQETSPFNNIDCLTWPIGLIDKKRLSGALSNRDGPPPETETAAPTGIGGGGKTGFHSGGFPEARTYQTGLTDAIRKRHPRLTSGSFYVLEPARNRWRIVVRRRGGEAIHFFETRADANRYRQRLTDDGLVGFVTGGVA